MGHNVVGLFRGMLQTPRDAMQRDEPLQRQRRRGGTPGGRRQRHPHRGKGLGRVAPAGRGRFASHRRNVDNALDAPWMTFFTYLLIFLCSFFLFLDFFLEAPKS